MPILNWLDREKDVKAAEDVPYRLLEADPKLSHGDADTENMLIQGDNLEALKALLPYYAGKVKCIYIDPPFNTQQAFDEYDDNLEHSIWLGVIFPRMELLHELLAEDGTIAIHIGDDELAYLIVILDEIFGRKNRVSICTFKQGAATGHKAINPGLVTVTNYVAIYAKNKRNWQPNRVFTGKARDNRYSRYIENVDEHFSNWRFTTLSNAFSQHMKESIKELKKSLGDEYEGHLNEFVLSHSMNVIRTARPDYNAVGEDVRKAIDESNKKADEIIFHARENHPDMYFINGERILFYRSKLKEIDGDLISGEPLTNLWDDLLSNNLHNEGNVKFPKNKKPENLIKRVLELCTKENDIVLDSFLGSGTTSAVAMKMRRRTIGIEMGDHALTMCHPRLKGVVDGEASGVSKSVRWQGGGGFKFYRLGQAIFDSEGHINENVKFKYLAAHIWFYETKTSLIKKPSSPFLGVHHGTAYYLLYNGVLGDKRPQGGNVLTNKVLADLESHDGPKVIYGESTLLGPARLANENITFKQTPYDVKAR